MANRPNRTSSDRVCFHEVPTALTAILGAPSPVADTCQNCHTRIKAPRSRGSGSVRPIQSRAMAFLNRDCGPLYGYLGCGRRPSVAGLRALWAREIILANAGTSLSVRGFGNRHAQSSPAAPMRAGPASPSPAGLFFARITPEQEVVQRRLKVGGILCSPQRRSALQTLPLSISTPAPG